MYWPYRCQACTARSGRHSSTSILCALLLWTRAMGSARPASLSRAATLGSWCCTPGCVAGAAAVCTAAQSMLPWRIAVPGCAAALNGKHGRKHLCGLERCTAMLQGWLGIKDTVLHSGEGAIQCVRWSSSLIAWANAVSTKVCAASGQGLGFRCRMPRYGGHGMPTHLPCAAHGTRSATAA